MNMKKIKTLLLTCAVIMAIAVPTFANEVPTIENGGSVIIEDVNVQPRTTVTVDNGLGEWRYNTSLTITLKKKITSDMDHSSKIHKTSCEIDGVKDDSGWEPARTTSRSSVTGPRSSTAYADWDVK